MSAFEPLPVPHMYVRCRFCLLYVLQSAASCAPSMAIIVDSQVRQDQFGMHTLDLRHPARRVHVCIKLGCAEAEAEANALRKRGLQLERRAQQVRAATKGSNASMATTAHNTGEGFVPQQRGSTQRMLPCKQEPAQQMHNPLSVMSQLPAEQTQDAQQWPGQRLPSEDAVSLNAQQQQAKASMTAEAVQHAVASPQAQAAAPQQEEQTPLAKAGLSSAAAVAAADEEVHGVGAQHEGPQSGVLQGMVVWGNFKGWPAWPGLVTTEEEMDVAEVIGKRGQMLQGMQAWPLSSST